MFTCSHILAVVGDHVCACLHASRYSRLCNITMTPASASASASLMAVSYAMEGFLRRLDQSSYRDMFVVRGSLITRMHVPNTPRTVVDIDLIAIYPNDASDEQPLTLQHIKHILQVPCNDDIEFLAEETEFVHTWEDTQSAGLRITLKYRIDGQPDQQPRNLGLDVGFDDPIVPSAERRLFSPLVFPTTSSPFPVLCVRPETMFAWKLHGLWEKEPTGGFSSAIGQGYWRPKDLFDLYLYAKFTKLDLEQLVDAVRTAFNFRRCPLHRLFRLARASLVRPIIRGEIGNGFATVHLQL
eukprot:m.15631 g.15631  ORF g.15631 m.15631 type:complete len:297 (+) comp9881_c0_seq1:37-927(+)